MGANSSSSSSGKKSGSSRKSENPMLASAKSNYEQAKISLARAREQLADFRKSPANRANKNGLANLQNLVESKKKDVERLKRAYDSARGK